jgi:hypothetical protein
MFIEVDIIGTGTMKDPYRPNIPKGISYSSYIPSGADGRPVLDKCLVCVRDDLELPKNAKFFAKQDALLSVKGRDARADIAKLKVAGAA